MELKYSEVSRSENSVSYSILSENNVQIGTIEGYVSKESLITVLHIESEFQGQGIGYEAFKKVYYDLNEKTKILKIIGSWHKDDEFSYCENGMATNLRLFQEGIKNGLS